jgi:hypothetical protein
MSRRCESSLTRFDLSFGEHLRLLVTPEETHDNSDKALRHLSGRDLRTTVLEMKLHTGPLRESAPRGISALPTAFMGG